MAKNNARSRHYWQGKPYTTHRHVYRQHSRLDYGMSCEICGQGCVRRLAAQAMDAGAYMFHDAAQPEST